jgi:hypothetical protein
MKKYLISSDYRYYDDFAFSNVCICDTKERAEELVIEFNKEKEKFKNTKGYILYLEKKLFENSVFLNYDKKYIEEESTIIKIFIEKKEFEENYKEIEVYCQENSYFEFLTFSNNKDSLLKKYCNHEDAKLIIEEIDFI